MCSIEPLFRDLSGDDPEPEVTEIESLCVNCYSKKGITRLLLTRIPYYKNVVIMSFSCEACGYANNEIQSGGAIADHGVRWKLDIMIQKDLDRQVVKSDHTTVRIPNLELEIPALSQKGEVTTIEGILDRVATGLSQEQATRKEQHREAAEKIEQFLKRLHELKDVTKNGPFTIELEDITGNCFVENPFAPKQDPHCVRTEFKRNIEQNHSLGIYTQDEVTGDVDTNKALLTPADLNQHTYENITGNEVLTFRTNCPECNAPADTNMKLTNIPHFKEVVIMSTSCDACGHRTNEVKSGGGIDKLGVKFQVSVANEKDFSRDILKSETCSMRIPELDLEVGGRALGGRFTTVEGLLMAARDQLLESTGALALGDAPSINDENVQMFMSKLNEVLECKRTVTIILDDPAGNSYVQSLADDPALPDDGLIIEHYERNFEQNEELGLNDMKTEGYEEENKTADDEAKCPT